MTRDDVIRMAREAGLSNEIGVFGYPYLPELERFAELIAAAERRECVIACEGVEQATESQSWVVSNCIEAILERGKV